MESLPWLVAARTLQCRTYLNSVSNCWPEAPEVDALGSIGVRTINWSYGANTFWYSGSESKRQDVAMSRSISCSREVWIWTEKVSRLLKRRAIGKLPRICITGAVMCGDSRWLDQSPEAARAAFGLALARGRKLISVFDVPPVNKATRLAIGHGPSIYPLEVLEQFFRDIESLLERLPNISVLVKPKRALDDPSRDYSPSMKRILGTSSDWLREGRIIAVSHNVDPYIPVALADICVGIPFTSPVLAAIDSGRGGVFHDPLRRANYVPQAPNLKAHLAQGTNELYERMSELVEIPYARREYTDPSVLFGRLLADDSA